MAREGSKPAINDDDHGPRVLLVGAVLLAATILMVVIAGYNRWHAKTLLRLDSVLLLLGAMLNVVFFALFALMVHDGYGKHVEDLSTGQLENIRKLFLSNWIVFFVAHCVVKISYNLLARRTARSYVYHAWIDCFSSAIVLWAISNVIVTAYYLATSVEPSRAFILASGAVSVLIVVGQLFAFLWIIWKTQARLVQKMQWSFCMTAFVPLCITAIICRLVYTPEEWFREDWSYDSVTVAMLFLIDLSIIIITVLSPNLPVFFAKTSTGGLNFMPNETLTARSKSNAESYKLDKGNGLHSHASSRPHDGRRDTVLTTISHCEGNDRSKSFGSDVIMLHRSVEIRAAEYHDSDFQVTSKSADAAEV